MTRDRVTLSGIEAFGYHGVLAHERQIGQRFEVDVTLGLDLETAATTDRLADTIDYGELAAEVSRIVSGGAVALIETLAQHIAEHCLSDARVAEVEVTVHKPSAPVLVPVRDVAVTVRRIRS